MRQITDPITSPVGLGQPIELIVGFAELVVIRDAKKENLR
jgi:hypothetical protein